MGMGASNMLDRVCASIGLLNEVEIKFQPSFDVPNAGVLLALPALLVTGLLRHAEKYFRLPRGYYGLKSIFLILAFMALVRLKSMERLRYVAPGEWGKFLGLDRIPEVRTMREKIAYLSNEGQPKEWSAELCREWMQSAAVESIGAFYVDGHVRVYHGHQTKLPRHYVARERLCLRATTDYWVNAIDGQPFFMVTQAVDPGLLQVLEKEIVPRLLEEVPHQPTPEQLESDRSTHRFTLIFDREGYSPDFFRKMKEQHRIACISYHKFPGDNWREQEFNTHHVKLPSGEKVQIRLAERGVLLGATLWVREVRKLTERGHQVSILSTDYRSDLAPIAVAMFARWSQENFFKYMREHYNLDRLIDYHTEEIPETTKVVNPQYRLLDSSIRTKNSTLSRRLADFAATSIKESIDSKEIEPPLQKKAQLLDEISQLQKEIEALKAQRKQLPKHITIAQLPDELRFRRLSTQSKHFIDTIKIIAYRAETAMAHLLKEKISRHDDARALLRAIYAAEADIIPDEKLNTITVNLHHLANHYSAHAIQHLCNELNQTETLFPATKLRLIYKLVSNNFP